MAKKRDGPESGCANRNSVTILRKCSPLAQAARLDCLVSNAGHNPAVRIAPYAARLASILAIPATTSAGSCPVVPITSARNIDARPKDVNTTSAASGDILSPISKTSIIRIIEVHG